METLIVYTSSFPKKRIGKENDGGYVIAELPGNYDLFISGGIADDNTFETSFLQKYTNIPCYAFDGSVSALPQPNEEIVFIKKYLGNRTNDTETNLHEYIEPYKHIFMKIDIEGHEFRLLPSFIENNFINKIKQLVIEIHSPADIALHPDYYVGLEHIKNKHMFDLFQKMNRTHTLIHFHANNGCDMNTIDGIHIPFVFELTYIRNDYIIEKKKNTESLPTSMDMQNVLYKPDYMLSGFPYCTNIV
jgi:hypothetical protein